MSDPVIVKLARFSPEARCDRDDLLFHAGRASAPGRRGWIVVAGVLAVSLVLTAVGWITDSRPATPAVPESRQTTIPAGPFDPVTPEPSSYRSLMTTWTGDDFPQGLDPGEPASAGRTLTIRSGWTSDLVD